MKLTYKYVRLPIKVTTQFRKVHGLNTIGYQLFIHTYLGGELIKKEKVKRVIKY